MLKHIEDGTAAARRLAEGAALRRTLDVDDPGDWLALDAGVRETHWSLPPLLPEWERAAGAFADAPPLDESRQALALCHRNGRIRQEAVHRSPSYPALLPLIVVRCTDWVGPVRQSARQVLRESLDAEAAAALASLVLRLGRRDRGDFAVGLLDEVLREMPRERFTPLLAAPDRAVRRFAHRLAAERGLLDAVELARAAVRDEDAVVQDLCATAALTALGAEAAHEEESHKETAYDDVLPLLLSARNPRTRSAGVTGLRRAGRTRQAEPFLADRSALVRACARYVVRQAGGDPLAWYRQRCSASGEAGPPPGVVRGLAECGDRADAGVLRALLAHPVPGVRAGAVAGLHTLDCADTGRLRPLLDDPAPRVVRETTTALLPSAKDLPADWLLARTGPERPRHVRVGAFRLLEAAGGITALRAAVGLLDDPDVKLRDWAGQCVQGWHPSADTRLFDPEVGELLDRGRHLFSDYVLRLRKREAGIGD
ncbi:hypothetical protein [Streptomyces mangrovisoli]|uniref:Uncharacterized protein n=1 Tax=Streptomyces mangrovisoli TaxID=1428628 RepID=A0A1J4NSS0_9ACTN|nr:hypothetical protein [Streptomyces mangrovisoli]OIJ65352.1 hypothetical protein WN71_024055 [Streptomyces mangrovisoli]